MYYFVQRRVYKECGSRIGARDKEHPVLRIGSMGFFQRTLHGHVIVYLYTCIYRTTVLILITIKRIISNFFVFTFVLLGKTFVYFFYSDNFVL